MMVGQPVATGDLAVRFRWSSMMPGQASLVSSLGGIGQTIFDSPIGQADYLAAFHQVL
jgi:hypothetical protein